MRGWDDPQTPAYYEAFCGAHSRYARANAALIAHARLAPGMRILDLAAGTGRTAQAALRRLGRDGSILCVEPSAAMREAGRRRLGDPRIAWCAQFAEARGRFDRILCGAAIWQLAPLEKAFHQLSALLSPGGALCFNIPALYLGEPDEPGGGCDPLLLDLPAQFVDSVDWPADEEVSEKGAFLDAAAIERWLKDAALGAEAWRFRLRFGQRAYAAWLKIPAVADRLCAGLTPDARAARIDAAVATVDAASWKWERWRGWTAWKG